MPLRIVFLGSDAIALPLLNWLAESAPEEVTVVGVFTQPDRPSGRGQREASNPIKTWALSRGLPVAQPERVDLASTELLKTWRPDLCLVMAYGHLLREDFFGVARLGTLNFHTSILPRYRGASPIQTAIASGESETGVTLMRIVRALDAGPVADVEKCSIQPDDTANEVESRLSTACVALLSRNLRKLVKGELQFQPQDHSRASYCRKLCKEDGVLDFSQPARNLAARVNGLYPWPSCSIDLDGLSVKLGLAVAEDDAPRPPDSPVGLPSQGCVPGRVIDARAEGLFVACGKGVLVLKRLQRPGGRMMPAADFLRGFIVAKGTVIPSRVMPALCSDRPFPYNVVSP